MEIDGVFEYALRDACVHRNAPAGQRIYPLTKKDSLRAELDGVFEYALRDACVHRNAPAGRRSII